MISKLSGKIKPSPRDKHAGVKDHAYGRGRI
jgi:hypothetical protein